MTSQAVAWSILHFAVIAAVSLTFGLGCYLFGRFPRLDPIPAVSTDRDGMQGGDWGDREVWEVARNEDLVRGDSDQGRAGQSPAAA